MSVRPLKIFFRLCVFVHQFIYKFTLPAHARRGQKTPQECPVFSCYLLPFPYPQGSLPGPYIKSFFVRLEASGLQWTPVIFLSSWFRLPWSYCQNTWLITGVLGSKLQSSYSQSNRVSPVPPCWLFHTYRIDIDAGVTHERTKESMTSIPFSCIMVNLI